MFYLCEGYQDTRGPQGRRATVAMSCSHSSVVDASSDMKAFTSAWTLDSKAFQKASNIVIGEDPSKNEDRVFLHCPFDTLLHIMFGHHCHPVL